MSDLAGHRDSSGVRCSPDVRLELTRDALAVVLAKADPEATQEKRDGALARSYVFRRRGGSEGQRRQASVADGHTARARLHGEVDQGPARVRQPSARSRMASAPRQGHARSRLGVTDGHLLERVEDRAADSMRRHDAKVARCKPVASEPTIEPPPARNDVSVVEGNSLIN